MENGAKKKKKQESVRASLPRLFWRQFERAIDLPVHLLLLLKCPSHKIFYFLIWNYTLLRTENWNIEKTEKNWNIGSLRRFCQYIEIFNFSK